MIDKLLTNPIRLAELPLTPRKRNVWLTPDTWSYEYIVTFVAGDAVVVQTDEAFYAQFFGNEKTANERYAKLLRKLKNFGAKKIK